MKEYRHGKHMICPAVDESDCRTGQWNVCEMGEGGWKAFDQWSTLQDCRDHLDKSAIAEAVFNARASFSNLEAFPSQDLTDFTTLLLHQMRGVGLSMPSLR